MSVSLNNVVQVNNAQPINQPTKKTDEKTKSFPTKTAVVVGTGLTALAAVGIYLATKGKGAKATQEVVPDIGQNAQEATHAIKEMTVDAFKQAGNKFNKGKALTSTGESFTGSITHQTKDGKNITMEYVDGLLKKSTKMSSDNKNVERIYNYNDENKLIQISENGKEIFKKTFIDAIGKTPAKVRIKLKDYAIIEKNSNLVWMRKGKTDTSIFKDGHKTVTHWDNGNAIQTEYYENNKLKVLEQLETRIENGKTTISFYDDNNRLKEQLYMDLLHRKAPITYITSDGSQYKIENEWINAPDDSDRKAFFKTITKQLGENKPLIEYEFEINKDGLSASKRHKLLSGLPLGTFDMTPEEQQKLRVIDKNRSKALSELEYWQKNYNTEKNKFLI